MAEHDVAELRERLDTHRAEIDEQAKAGYLAEQAEQLFTALSTALGRWDDLDDTKRATLADAVLYVVDVEDAEHDADSPLGLQDDAAIVRSALRQVAPDIQV
ncbi:MAG: hypothetical protein GEV07_27790 [Streptosporangiales bacterium]|nr:hypothetical protein [Streptosporangiales bacterium]